MIGAARSTSRPGAERAGSRRLGQFVEHAERCQSAGATPPGVIGVARAATAMTTFVSSTARIESGAAARLARFSDVADSVDARAQLWCATRRSPLDVRYKHAVCSLVCGRGYGRHLPARSIDLVASIQHAFMISPDLRPLPTETMRFMVRTSPNRNQRNSYHYIN
jgi:hypothetical protein